jgi:hypothetical protein
MGVGHYDGSRASEVYGSSMAVVNHVKGIVAEHL